MRFISTPLCSLTRADDNRYTFTKNNLISTALERNIPERAAEISSPHYDVVLGNFGPNPVSCADPDRRLMTEIVFNCDRNRNKGSLVNGVAE